MTDQKELEEFDGAVGIDLGTTFSCVAVWQNERVQILSNDQGQPTTPSYVAFSEEGRLIGTAAANQCARNPINTIFDAKRLIGRSFDDPSTKADMKRWPFKVVDRANKPVLEVSYEGEDRQFAPEEISAMVLTKMKEIAETTLQKKVTKAVVTVPAYFNDSQRQATKNAGAIAGLDVLRIINEPTAAAIAYGLERQKGSEHVLIFDLGGGTFDVSLLKLDGGIFQVVATAGDTHLGGEDFDNNLVDHLVKEFKRAHKKDVDNPRALRRLRTAAERAKRALSGQTRTVLEVESLIDGIDFQCTLTRAKFEQLNEALFKKCMAPVEQVLNDAKVEKKIIKEVVLVGGSTRIPRVQALLSEFFGGKELNKSINPDEAVAHGAAVQAAILTGQKSSKTKDLLLLDVVPLSLGVEIVGGVMSNVISRNSTIPTRETKTFTTDADNQTQVVFPVYEGERKFTRDNHLLGEFSLTGIAPAKRGIPQLDVTFDIDANGIMKVSALDKATGRTSNITIDKNAGLMSKDEIERLVKEADRFKSDDRERMDAVKSRGKVEDFCYSIQNAVDETLTQYLDQMRIDQVHEKVAETLEWLDMNKDSKKERFDSKLREVEQFWSPHSTAAYKNQQESQGKSGVRNGMRRTRRR